MQVPSILQGDSIKRLLQGAATGAIATMIIGFGFGGWTLGGTAEKMAADQSNAAVVAALTPYCVARFEAQGDMTAKWAAYKKLETWDRSTSITKAGFATALGSTDANDDVAHACADKLDTIAAKQVAAK